MASNKIYKLEWSKRKAQTREDEMKITAKIERAGERSWAWEVMRGKRLLGNGICQDLDVAADNIAYCIKHQEKAH